MSRLILSGHEMNVARVLIFEVSYFRGEHESFLLSDTQLVAADFVHHKFEIKFQR